MKKLKTRLLPLLLALALLCACAAPQAKSPFEQAAAYALQKYAQPGACAADWSVMALARGGADVPEGYFDGYYASVEAYNFLALCGGNWKSAELSLVPGIPYKAFGMVMIVLAVVLSVAMQVVSRRREGGETLRARPERLLIPAAFCMFMIFTFGHYMHERYVFPVMALLAFAYAATRDNRLLVSSMLLSVVLALNETTAMYVVSNAASAAVRGTQQHQIVIGVCSLFEVLTFFYTAKVCLERGFGQKDRR